MLAMIALALATAAQVPAATEVSTPGPLAPIQGTLLDPKANGPVIVMIAGSGPTDRDGNNPLGVRAQPYKLLAEALAARHIATLRFDKRGQLASKPAIADGNAVTIADYAADAHAFAALAAQATGQKCAWLLGHSEGGLIALQAAQDPRGLCGLILVSAPGRKLAEVLREQLRANPANAPILTPALAAIDALEQGHRVGLAQLPDGLDHLFPPDVQGFVIDLFAHDPAALAAKVKLPVLILQGDHDLQVALADAQALAAADPHARLVIVPGMNHVLKAAPADRTGNLATYADPSLPVMPEAVEAIAGFVKP